MTGSLGIGIVGLAAILFLLFLRMPVGLVLGGVSFFGIWALTGPQAVIGALKTIPYEFSAHWSLSAIPMFLLMGAIVHGSGLTSSIFAAARLWLGGLPGGLAVATNFASAGFAAASGSSLATATAMARIGIPEMLRHRYDPGLAAGVVACAGTLGAMIPPSIMFVLYGVFAEESISKLLIAGILPGILTAVIYAAMIVIRCVLNPELAPPVAQAATWRERMQSLAGIWPLPVLILSIVGGIYSGVATAMEAGAFGAFIAVIIVIVTGRFRFRDMAASALEAANTTATIFFIAIGAVLLTRFVVLTGLPFALADLMADTVSGKLGFLLFLSAVYIVAGMFLDPIGILLITIPLFLPSFQALGLDGIWMGVIVIKFLEIGLITPPVGLNVYAVKSTVGSALTLGQMFRGVGWFLACEALVVVLLIGFPQIALFLPEYVR